LVFVEFGHYYSIRSKSGFESKVDQKQLNCGKDMVWVKEDENGEGLRDKWQGRLGGGVKKTGTSVTIEVD
jgi:hypothetical protein